MLQAWLRRRLERVVWDEWRGSSSDATMLIKHLARLPLGRGRAIRLDLHKMLKPDDRGCFHSHPAYAVRMPLVGGYEEEVHSPMFLWGVWGYFDEWRPGRIGIVKPTLEHRIHRLLDGPSYSLWLRGPVCAEVRLVGPGWPPGARPA